LAPVSLNIQVSDYDIDENCKDFQTDTYNKAFIKIRMPNLNN